jgi:uncharacterized protein YqfB (UPF0267 family)
MTHYLCHLFCYLLSKICLFDFALCDILNYMARTNTTLTPDEATESLVKETFAIAHRLNELGFHDEADMLLSKTDKISAGKVVLSTVALQHLINESVTLDKIAQEIKGIYINSRPMNYTHQIKMLLTEALIEIITLNGGVIDKKLAKVLTAHRTRVAVSFMPATIAHACQVGKIKQRTGKISTLELV